jgi:hypothetical protein
MEKCATYLLFIVFIIASSSCKDYKNLNKQDINLIHIKDTSSVSEYEKLYIQSFGLGNNRQNALDSSRIKSVLILAEDLKAILTLLQLDFKPLRINEVTLADSFKIDVVLKTDSIKYTEGLRETIIKYKAIPIKCKILKEQAYKIRRGQYMAITELVVPIQSLKDLYIISLAKNNNQMSDYDYEKFKKVFEEEMAKIDQ